VTVYLVGAGPGDPGLLTLRGRELLERCDALVYDALADPRIVAMAAVDAERHYAGKRAGAHALTQDEINGLLVDLGRRCECVVRLKGGDPFIFGRGGEEALELRAAGVEFEVVPGVSSAHAVPAYAGIPVTQRGVAAQMTVVTGHEDPNRPESGVDWDGLAADPGTLVFLMGVRALPRIAAKLIAAGLDATTPAAVVSQGTLPTQRTVTAPLGEIAKAAAELPAPAIIVIGPVAALHDQIAWFERRPLFGRRIAVTRARAQASSLAAQLTELGAAVVEAPAIRIESIAFDDADVAGHDLICLTSANGVDRLLSGDVRRFAGVTIAVVGRATADAARARGVEPDVIAATATQEGLLDSLGDVAGRRALVATAEGARDVLADGLRSGGADVQQLRLYRSVAEPVDREAVMGCDWVTFTASSTVTNVLSGLEPADLERLQAVSIGPITSETLRAAGIEPVIEADPHDVEGLVDAVLRLARVTA
jgi:uroporphyrinogen III methyltransferase/synthase